MSSKNICLIGASSDLGIEIAKLCKEIDGLYVYGVSQSNAEIDVLYERVLSISSYDTRKQEITAFVRENEISDIILLNGYIGKNNHPVEKIVQINLSIPLALISHLEDSNLKNITYTVISSLAASRPRDKNYVYGLSKYMLEESLLSRPTGRYIIFRSGFIRTKMTKDHKEPPFSKNPEQVAEKIINSITNNQKRISIKYSSFQVMFLFYIFKVIPLYILNTIERKLL